MAPPVADENFPLPVVEQLRQLGHDVLTLQEMGYGNRVALDDTVLLLAAGEGRALLTSNRKHFIGMHRHGAEHAGVIACTVDPDCSALAARIDAAIKALPELARELVRVIRPPL